MRGKSILGSGGDSAIMTRFAAIAQLVERRIRNP